MLEIDTPLSLLALLTGLAYIGLMLAGLRKGFSSKADLLDIERSLKFYVAAFGVQLINTAIDVMRIDSDGWGPIAVDAVTLLAVALSVFFAGKRADRLEGVNR